MRVKGEASPAARFLTSSEASIVSQILALRAILAAKILQPSASELSERTN